MEAQIKYNISHMLHGLGNKSFFFFRNILDIIIIMLTSKAHGCENSAVLQWLLSCTAYCTVNNFVLTDSSFHALHLSDFQISNLASLWGPFQL